MVNKDVNTCRIFETLTIVALNSYFKYLQIEIKLTLTLQHASYNALSLLEIEETSSTNETRK